MKKTIVAVNGYGCHMHIGYECYLDRVGRYCSDRANRVTWLLLCGGPTEQASAPGTTEAAVMEAYLRWKYDLKMPITLIDTSLIAYDDVAGVAGSLRQHASPEVDRLVYFCDAGRALDIKIHLGELLPDGWDYRVETDDLTPPWDTLGLISNGLNALLEHRVPGYVQFRRWMRRRRAARI